MTVQELKNYLPATNLRFTEWPEIISKWPIDEQAARIDLNNWIIQIQQNVDNTPSDVKKTNYFYGFLITGPMINVKEDYITQNQNAADANIRHIEYLFNELITELKNILNIRPPEFINYLLNIENRFQEIINLNSKRGNQIIADLIKPKSFSDFTYYIDSCQAETKTFQQAASAENELINIKVNLTAQIENRKSQIENDLINFQADWMQKAQTKKEYYQNEILKLQ